MNIVTRAQAIESGLKRYFTGVPCKHGHVDERITENGTCIVCASNTKRLSAQKHIEKKRSKRRETYQANAPAMREYHRAYYASNSEKISARNTKWRQGNAIQMSEILEAWRKANPEKVRQKAAARRARKLSAAPLWFGELDDLVWKEAADLCIKREKATGVAWHADHMIPMAAKLACGLHVAINCQVIPATINTKKCNRLWLTEPLEWLQHL